MLGEPKKHFSLTRAALRTGGGAKSEFLSVIATPSKADGLRRLAARLTSYGLIGSAFLPLAREAYAQNQPPLAKPIQPATPDAIPLLQKRLKDLKADLPKTNQVTLASELAKNIAELLPSERKLLLALDFLSHSTPATHKIAGGTLEQALNERPAATSTNYAAIRKSAVESLSQLERYYDIATSDPFRANNADYRAELQRLVDLDEKRKAVGIVFEGKIDVYGNAITREELQGKVVMVVFWATWCGPCRNEIPGLRRVAEQYKDDLVILAFADSQDDPKKLPDFMTRNGINYRVFYDANDVMANGLFVDLLPFSLVYTERKLIAQRPGGQTPEQLQQFLIPAHLPERPEFAAQPGNSAK